MTLNLNVPAIQPNLTPQITVIGVGGAGGNAVNNMIQSNLEGVDFLITNTDAQAIQQSLCEHCIQLGRGVTQGLGSGSRPDVGRAAAEEALDEILTELEGANMLFITAGMGGGTGTGGAPVIARAAREAGILTVGVVTKPFHFEGVHRMRIAETGITELTQYVDTLIVIPNQNLFRIANEKTTFADAFKMADDVLHSGVRGVTDLMVMPGLINLDFADIRAVMTEMGKAMMGTGEAEGENRALAAAEAAISNPLLDDVSMKGARGVLINITGGPDLTLFEVDETANRIRDEVDPEANIIFGSTFGQDLEGRIRVSVVATGIDAEEAAVPRPVTLSLVSDRKQQAAAAMTDGSYAIAEAPAEAELQVAPEPAARPAEAQGPSGLYAYSQAALQGTVAEAAAGPAAQASAAAAPATVAVGAAQTAVAVADPAPQDVAMQAETPLEPAELRADDSFIAPPPVEPEPAPAPASPAEADPFAAAAMENGSRAPRGPEHPTTMAAPPKKAPGLFAKMTGGAARALQAATQSGAQRNPAAMAVPGTRPAAHAAAEPRMAAEPSLRAPTVPAAEPRLAGLESAERDSGGQLDEDLLDIPAFLRRQAN